MSIEILIPFGVAAIGVVFILNALCRVIVKFIELADKLGSLIEVTYQATHDPNFGCELSKDEDVPQDK